MVLDNHATLCTLQAYNFCGNNGIIVLTILRHTSHRLQPLNVSVFFSLKAAYNPNQSCREIAELFNKAFGREATPERAIKGFSETGLFPFNTDNFTEEDFASAENLQKRQCITIKENKEENRRNEKTPEKVTQLNSVELKNISFAEIIPIPSCSTNKTDRPKGKSTEQNSIIFTSTPLKDVLEEKQKIETVES